MRELKKDAGQALVVVALGMVVLMGFLGLGFDLGYLRYQRRLVQKAADAAAVAAAMELTLFGSGSPQVTTAAEKALVENGFTATPTLITNAGSCSTSSPSLTIWVNNPPICLGITDPHYNNKSYVEVVVSQGQPLMFASIFGSRTFSMSARSEGALGSGSNCIFALDPAAPQAIYVDGLAAINSKCGIVDESSSSSALTCALLSSITASQIGIVGGDSINFCTVRPTPKTKIAVPNPPDPLAYLPKPPAGACGPPPVGITYSGWPGTTGGLVINGPAILQAGVYCGGIQLTAGAVAAFQSGTYILTSPVAGTAYGLTVDIGSRAVGSGVTFYNTTSGGAQGPIAFSWNGFFGGYGVNFTAPTSGPYEGILFFQDPLNTQTATIQGSPAWSTTLEGTYYFPNAKVLFTFDGPVRYNILVAKDIEFQYFAWAAGGYTAAFSNDFSSLADGSPVKGTGGVVVE